MYAGRLASFVWKVGMKLVTDDELHSKGPEWKTKVWLHKKSAKSPNTAFSYYIQGLNYRVTNTSCRHRTLGI